MKRLPPLPSIRQLLKIYQLRAQKQLSQNFLLNVRVTDNIIRSIAPTFEDSLVIEVGPGPGSLTRSILNAKAAKVIVIEKDARFLPLLNQLGEASYGRLTILNNDILTIPHSEILGAVGSGVAFKNTFILGNLPFNVGTPMLIQWLKMIHQKEGMFQLPNIVMGLMFQKELVERMAARVGQHQRSRLSVMTQTFCESVEQRLMVDHYAFTPVPEVDAAVVRMIPRETSLVHSSFDSYELVVKQSFSQIKKIMKNSFGASVPNGMEMMKLAGINPESRAIELHIDDFVRLTRAYEQLK